LIAKNNIPEAETSKSNQEHKPKKTAAKNINKKQSALNPE